LKKIVLIKTVLVILPFALGLSLASIFIFLGEGTAAIIAFVIGFILGGIILTTGVAYFTYRLIKTYHSESSTTISRRRSN